MRRVPMLGFATVTSAVMSMVDQGLSDGEIALKIDRKENYVSSIRSALKRRPGRSVVQIGVPRSLHASLERHARARGVTVAEIVRRLLYLTIEEGLVDAVLDDKEEA